jgi:hypothetical protein
MLEYDLDELELHVECRKSLLNILFYPAQLLSLLHFSSFYILFKLPLTEGQSGSRKCIPAPLQLNAVSHYSPYPLLTLLSHSICFRS